MKPETNEMHRTNAVRLLRVPIFQGKSSTLPQGARLGRNAIEFWNTRGSINQGVVRFVEPMVSVMGLYLQVVMAENRRHPSQNEANGISQSGCDFTIGHAVDGNRRTSPALHL
ncbi:hypothetical protein ACJ73_07301 [Blastomyces percursus]|uniref:Uncharacterized protein n=1 Tax=Blastomyces percursus TaxID=1658174 RepID=A0A1J9QYS9_9EURO|nr:hypothetical protein ACJ73_07301 [Blastomyces percursus]